MGGGGQDGERLDDPEPPVERRTGSDPVGFIKLVAQKVPVVWLALALTAIAAAMGMARTFLGNMDYDAMLTVLLASMLAMLLLYIITQAARLDKPRATPIALTLTWSVCLAVVCFMLLTLTAVSFGWPPTMVALLHLPAQPAVIKPAEKPDQAAVHPNPAKQVVPAKEQAPPAAFVGQIGVVFTCKDCPPDSLFLQRPRQVQFGVSAAPLDDDPPTEASIWHSLDLPSEGKWVPVYLPTEAARVRVLIPNAEAKNGHANDFIAKVVGGPGEMPIRLTSGQKVLMTIALDKAFGYAETKRLRIAQISLSYPR